MKTLLAGRFTGCAEGVLELVLGALGCGEELLPAAARDAFPKVVLGLGVGKTEGLARLSPSK